MSKRHSDRPVYVIFWPCYTIIGTTITLLTAWLVRRLLPEPKPVAEALNQQYRQVAYGEKEAQRELRLR